MGGKNGFSPPEPPNYLSCFQREFNQLKEKEEKMKIASWDLETSGFNADFAVILCCCIKPLNGKIITLASGRKGSNDKTLCARIKLELEKFDMLACHYGNGFDRKFLNARLAKWGLEELAPRFHIDTFYVSRSAFGVSSKSLKSLADFFNLGDKSNVSGRDWTAAALDGNKEALREIITHNEKDVVLLEKLFLILLPYIKTISRS